MPLLLPARDRINFIQKIVGDAEIYSDVNDFNFTDEMLSPLEKEKFLGRLDWEKRRLGAQNCGTIMFENKLHLKVELQGSSKLLNFDNFLSNLKRSFHQLAQSSKCMLKFSTSRNLIKCSALHDLPQKHEFNEKYENGSIMRTNIILYAS